MNADRLKEAWVNRALVAEGVKNSVFRSDDVEAVFVERLEKCVGCEFYSGNIKGKEYGDMPEAVRKHRTEKELDGVRDYTGEVCVYCEFCLIEIKLRAMKARCPLDPPRWDRVVEPGSGEDGEIKVKIDL